MIFTCYVAVASWYDGDTFRGVLDEGNRHYIGSGLTVQADSTVTLGVIRQRCALIQAPELGTAAGPASLAYARQLAPPGIYQCNTYKAEDEFCRPLIDLILPDGRLFSAAMLAAGMAVPYPSRVISAA